MSALQTATWTAGSGMCPTIVATAAINGLAFSPYQTWALRRAEQTAFAHSPFICPNGAPATMAQVSTLPVHWHGADRLSALMSAAIAQLLPDTHALGRARRIACMLLLPTRMLGGERTTPSALGQRDRLLRELPTLLGPLSSATQIFPWPRGHASAAFALREAGAAIAGGQFDAAILIGVDSYYDPEVAQQLIDDKRIYDGENTDACIAGEGVAACLITTASIAASERWPKLAHIEAASTNLEPATHFNDVPCDGQALSETARAALTQVIKERRSVDLWLTDLTAEDLRNHELQLAWPRFAHACMGPTSRMEHLPQHLGDLGAATLPTGMAIVAEMFRRNDGTLNTCLLTACSPTGERGAIVLRRPGPAL